MIERPRKLFVLGSSTRIRGVESAGWFDKNLPNLADYDVIVVGTHALIQDFNELNSRLRAMADTAGQGKALVKTYRERLAWIGDRLARVLKTNGTVVAILRSPPVVIAGSAQKGFLRLEGGAWLPIEVEVVREPGDTLTAPPGPLAGYLSLVKVGAEPEGVRLSPDGSVVFVTSESDTSIAVLDSQSGKELARIKVGLRPRDVAFSPDGKWAYATAEVGGTVSVIDVAKKTVIKTILMPQAARPMGIRVSPDGKRIFVATGRGGTVEVIDAATLHTTASVKVGQRPWGLALTADGRKLYTANGPSNDVSVLDTGTLTVTGTIAVGKIPWGVAIGKAVP